ncbi:hypothetical protein WIV_gp018 [Wiseana iridescent virus]|uniref:Uncharacterized protein n=1 Tax=Wiseana iridescent virus TaxID=68347 RepID=G0T544_IRV9|nr:hypothetical protein WIV_gp018 [Wiseana iridescent virus]ADO00361.1 hypothetical protein [Wiseana iridescent virus]
MIKETINLGGVSPQIKVDNNLLGNIKNLTYNTHGMSMRCNRQRKDIMSRLSSTINGNKKDLWSQIKELTGWISSKTEIDEGSFKYKITY